MRRYIFCSLWIVLGYALLVSPLAADVYRWDNNQLIPGTEGITPGPGVQLDHRELEYARLESFVLIGANFELSNLTSARLDESNLTSANLSGANLTRATFRGRPNLTDANLTNANLTRAQLAATTLTNANLSNANLTIATLTAATLTDANLNNADLTGALLDASTLTNANLAGAVVTAANFGITTSQGFTREQLESTASYQAKDLRGIALGYNDLTGWDLSGQNLTGADFRESTLTNANLSGANLTSADLQISTLTRTNLTEANLTGAWLNNSTLTGANLTGAVVTGASFEDMTSRGFTRGLLESTASYQAKDLHDINLSRNYLTGWDFSGQNLTNANLWGSTLKNANLSGAVVAKAIFSNTTSLGFTRGQLESTASYQTKDLHGVLLTQNNLTDWDFSGQNLTGAALAYSTLTNANLAGAMVTWADLSGTGLTQAQLASTASYQAKNLQGIRLWGNDLTGWDFSGQNLTDAALGSSTLTNANLTGAVVARAEFERATSRGFTREQLESTASYQAKDLHGISLADDNDLTGWDFSGQDLTGAYLSDSTLTSVNLSGANLTGARLERSMLRNANLSGVSLKNAKLDNAISLSSATFDAATVYNQWTIFPQNFNPIAAGLTLVISPPGDLDADDRLSAADVDMVARPGLLAPYWLPFGAFDLNGDGSINHADHRVWVKDLAHTWYGDANLDGEFNSTDLIDALAAGTYEADMAAGWASGDFDGNGHFDSSDLIEALADGGYEQGLRPPAAAAVPEPQACALLTMGLVVALCGRRTRRGI
jgi:uncharacterized protein YjbI with pentapeptide repeats